MLSPHFSRDEFRCPHCRRYRRVPQALLSLLERIREIDGTPLRIVSGYRCTVYNRTIGGASHSRHLVGDAADIPAGRVTTQQAIALGARGVGSRGPWAVHVDVRPGRVTTWRYD